ncbi:MAG: asparagine synthase-related protein [Sphingomonas sp.]
MTGFAGCIGPYDPAIARAMAQAIARLGPDRREQWQGEGAFLAHALLATTFEEERDAQPLSFDGRYHLVADARIDGREELVAALRAAGRPADPDAPDSALILHAWHAWGEACPERLIGDFAFAIWDSRERSLFAARDQFGSVPFYYGRAGDAFLFANAVPALLAHPALDRALNPVAIGDYLMLGYSLDRDAGFHRHIARLPPAHCMTMRDGAVRLRRYWRLPDPDFAEAGKMPPEEVVERFGAILTAAVRDRLRAPRVATTLSGGMDSTMIAGTALREAAGRTRIEAWSYGTDWILPDTERHWAWRCAHHLGLPFHSVGVERAFTDPPGGIFRVPPEPRLEIRTSSFQLVGDELAEQGSGCCCSAWAATWWWLGESAIGRGWSATAASAACCARRGAIGSIIAVVRRCGPPGCARARTARCRSSRRSIPASRVSTGSRSAGATITPRRCAIRAGTWRSIPSGPRCSSPRTPNRPACRCARASRCSTCGCSRRRCGCRPRPGSSTRRSCGGWARNAARRDPRAPQDAVRRQRRLGSGAPRLRALACRIARGARAGGICRSRAAGADRGQPRCAGARALFRFGHAPGRPRRLAANGPVTNLMREYSCVPCY